MGDRHTRVPTGQEIAEINARHLIRTPIKPADLLFVFGTRDDVAQRVDEAFRLWREGFFRWSIVSGGMTPGSKLSECEIIKSAMVARGVPPERIGKTGHVLFREKWEAPFFAELSWLCLCNPVAQIRLRRAVGAAARGNRSRG